MKLFEVATDDVPSAELDAKTFEHIITPAIIHLNQLFEEHGYGIRMVGGAVRDIIAGKEPKDIDFCTNATPQEMIALCKRTGTKYIETGLQHGTITIVIDGELFEVTTLRIDVDTDGRHATVAFTRDWKEDAARRDLTINAMSMDLDGNVYDYFDGIEDIHNKNVKFVGDPSARIQEDYLRILRYFRFLGRAQGMTDANTMAAIRKNAQGLNSISGERIRMEMEKIIMGPNASYVLEEMRSAGLFSTLGLTTIPKNLDNIATVCKFITIVAALVDCDKKAFSNLINRWKLSSVEAVFGDAVCDVMKNHSDVNAAKRVIALSNKPEFYKDVMVEAYRLRQLTGAANTINNWNIPKFPVGGADLISLGVKPGPMMGKILADLKKIWADENYDTSREELLSRITN